MSRFNVCLVKIAGYPHIEALAELAELITLALRDLGHQARLSRHQVDPGCRNIILGCHLLEPSLAASVPKGSIAINSEQLSVESNMVNGAVAGWARHVEMWDYSPRNIEFLAERHGVTAKLLRIGYHPALHRIARAADQDIGVYFYGTVNDRRRAVLEALEAGGLIPAHSFGVYGAARDALIARSKLVLNIHRFEAQIFEVVRVSYLMNNAKAVVAEINPETSVEPGYAEGICGVPYDDIADACRRLIDDDKARLALEEQALATLRRMPQSELLAPLLG